MHRRLVVAAFAAVALAAAAVPAVSAVEPVKTEINESFPWGGTLDWGCGFPITPGSILVGAETRFYDQDGNLVRIETRVSAREWYAANGKALVSEPFQLHTTVLDPSYSDFGRYVRWHSSAERIPLPDGTVVFLGRGGIAVWDVVADTWKITPNQFLEVDPAVLCDALAP